MRTDDTTQNNTYDSDLFLTAADDYMPGQLILELGTTKASKDNPSRIQVSETEYILPPRLIYHACEPNAYIDWEQMTLRALREIPKNEMVTYHYGTSEYDYEVGAFQCDCGSKRCVRFFSGFRHMSPDQQADIADHISAYIRSKWLQQ